MIGSNYRTIASNGVIFCLFSLLLQFCSCDLTELWSIEQLDDMIISDAFGKQVPALQPAIIALYETECKNRLYKEIGFTDNKFPRGMHLQFATFDRTIATKEPWYEWHAEIMDVFYRYNISTSDYSSIDDWCPIIIYQPANWSLPIEYFNWKEIKSEGKNLAKEFETWVWNMIKIPKIEFVNTLKDKSVKLLFRYMNPGSKKEVDIVNEQIIAIIPANSKVEVENLHGGDIIVATTEDDKTINRFIIKTYTKSIEITESKDEEIIDDSKFDSKFSSEYDLLMRRNWSTRRRFLNNIKSPPLMPSYTETGFYHGKAPKEICDYVTSFYNQEKDKKRLESFPSDGTQINVREIPTYMMHIPGNKKRWIAEVMEPLLSEWAGVPLKYSTMYGLREYVKGAVLKGHVDRIETHIISAIIHVTHSPQNISWPLEVVSWDGERHYVEDGDCDMVFYESSKLIHGRPSTYQGESWVNAFLHFRPDPWVGYTFTPQNVIKTPNGEKPLVDFIYG